MLELISVNVSYGAVRALTDVSIKVEEGTIVTLIGANGAGKSSLLNAVSGVIPFKGSIMWQGSRMPSLPSEIVKAGVVQVPEGRQIFSNLSVYENLLAGAYLKWEKAKIMKNLGRVYELFPRLLERKGQSAGTLSGGERQMLAIGRGLMSEPHLLLIDEPSLGLSPLLTNEVLQLIVEVNKQGVTVLLVEQNARKSLGIAHKGYVLQNGRVVLQGTGKQLLDDVSVQEAYLGVSTRECNAKS
jgi:branched-chain amino acid transport system ATP-binding protein